jgi:hypothetical protein
LDRVSETRQVNEKTQYVAIYDYLEVFLRPYVTESIKVKFSMKTYGGVEV